MYMPTGAWYQCWDPIEGFVGIAHFVPTDHPTALCNKLGDVPALVQRDDARRCLKCWWLLWTDGGHRPWLRIDFRKLLAVKPSITSQEPAVYLPVASLLSKPAVFFAAAVLLVLLALSVVAIRGCHRRAGPPTEPVAVFVGPAGEPKAIGCQAKPAIEGSVCVCSGEIWMCKKQ